MKEYDRLEKDMLKEIGNIGAGRAAGTLSKFIHQEVSMSLPYLKQLDNLDDVFNKILENFQIKDDQFSMVYTTIQENEAYLLFSLMPLRSCEKLIKLSFEEDVDLSKQSTPILKSLIKEIGSILLISNVDALNKFVQIDHIHYPGCIEIGTIDKLKENYKKEIKKLKSIDLNTLKSFLFINLSIWVVDEDISAYIGLIPSSETVEQFLKNLHL